MTRPGRRPIRPIGAARRVSYDVRIWKISTYQGKNGRTYTVRWTVTGKPHRRTFKTYALADSFRADLVSAAREGLAFDVLTGLPNRPSADEGPTWFEFACAYVDHKWKRAAPKTRIGIADALATVTFAFLATERGRPGDHEIRHALCRWAFNANKRRKGDPPAELARTVEWLRRNTLRMPLVGDVDTLRRALDRVALTMNGSPASANTVKRKRAVFFNALEFAVERKHFEINPLLSVVWSAPEAVDQVDRRRVVNPRQARRLLDAVAEQGSIGEHLKAFFGCMYYSALRPAEVVGLTEGEVELPDADEWGWFHLGESAPDAGTPWTDTGTPRQRRQLKHRGRGVVRSVPIPPELVRLLRPLLNDTAGRRLFRGKRGGDVHSRVYLDVWGAARRAALTRAETASPLAKRPYDLRHACVSTWLNAGVPAPQVAEWAGHSVDVLLRVYAKCIVGQEDAARKRIQAALSADGENGR